MLCAYLSIDEVNQATAHRLATALGAELDAITFQGADLAGPYDAIAYDLDFLPPDYRQRLLDRLAKGKPDEPVAMHGYSLSPEQRRDLRRQGVIVSRRLTTGLFLRLRAKLLASNAEAGIELPMGR